MLTDVDAEFKESAVNPRRAPERISRDSSTNQLAHVLRDCRAARLAHEGLSRSDNHRELLRSHATTVAGFDDDQEDRQSLQTSA